MESVAPEGTLYLSARLDLLGRTIDGQRLETNDDIRKALLERAGLGVVPFQAFGLAREDGWFRLSVGGVSLRTIEEGMDRLQAMLETLA